MRQVAPWIAEALRTREDADRLAAIRKDVGGSAAASRSPGSGAERGEPRRRARDEGGLSRRPLQPLPEAATGRATVGALARAAPKAGTVTSGVFAGRQRLQPLDGLEVLLDEAVDEPPDGPVSFIWPTIWPTGLNVDLLRLRPRSGGPRATASHVTMNWSGMPSGFGLSGRLPGLGPVVRSMRQGLPVHERERTVSLLVGLEVATRVCAGGASASSTVSQSEPVHTPCAPIASAAAICRRCRCRRRRARHRRDGVDHLRARARRCRSRRCDRRPRCPAR